MPEGVRNGSGLNHRLGLFKYQDQHNGAQTPVTMAHTQPCFGGLHNTDPGPWPGSLLVTVTDVQFKVTLDPLRNEGNSVGTTLNQSSLLWENSVQLCILIKIIADDIHFCSGFQHFALYNISFFKKNSICTCYFQHIIFDYRSTG